MTTAANHRHTVTARIDHTIPAPGTEYPFSVSDITHATARLLGEGWYAEAGPWGVAGILYGPYLTKFEFFVDYDSDFCITYTKHESDDFPAEPELPDRVAKYGECVCLEEAQAADGLDVLAARCAATILAVTGYTRDDFDFESSASRQHYTDTGRYLRRGEAESV